MTIRSAVDWWFRNRETGEITIAQFPNPPLWVFLGTVVLRRVVPDGAARTVVDWVGVAALAWWATDEVARGVNPWRRLLGVGGCIAVCVSVIGLL